MEHKYFRLLQKGERFEKDNDFVVAGNDIKPLVFDGTINDDPRKDNYALRPISLGGEWIAYRDRVPTAADAVDDRLVVYQRGNIWIWTVGYSDIERTSYWLKVTPPQKIPIFIDDKEIKFQPNGDLVVGCTTIPAAQFEEIRQRREAARK